MTISEENDKYLNYYFDYISPSRGLMLQALEYMAEYKGQGAEYISCSFNPEDEDYFEGKVTLFFWEPAVDKDTMVIVDNMMFYQYLLKTCEKHISKYPDDIKVINDYLKQISFHLNIVCDFF